MNSASTMARYSVFRASAIASTYSSSVPPPVGVVDDDDFLDHGVSSAGRVRARIGLSARRMGAVNRAAVVNEQARLGPS
jgi:hypothetical protein